MQSNKNSDSRREEQHKQLMLQNALLAKARKRKLQQQQQATGQILDEQGKANNIKNNDGRSEVCIMNLNL
jgi:hypothetical protein